MNPFVRRAAPLALALVFIFCGVPAMAGVVNPDISLIGQPRIQWTDDPGNSSFQRATFEIGETELLFDAALNPYSHGTAVLTFGDEGAEVEEAFFLLTRGLPGGLGLKGGKYRAGFGRLNSAHPHTYPFAERFRVLAAYLPGEESLNETGLQLSGRIPVPGDLSLTASADWLQGDSFRIPRESTGLPNDPLELPFGAGDREDEPRPAALGRLAGFVPIGDRSGVELGFSALQGTSNVAAAARTTLLGGDAKLKLWTAPTSYLVVQGEFLHLEQDEPAWNAAAVGYFRHPFGHSGGYVFADYNWATRFNAGVSFERFEDPFWGDANHAFGVFAGFALLEESTVFRLAWERYEPGRERVSIDALPPSDPVHTVTLRVVWSMGPHQAHQF